MTSVRSFLLISLCILWIGPQINAQTDAKKIWYGFFVNTSIPVGGFADASSVSNGCGNTGFGGEIYMMSELKTSTKLFTSLNTNYNSVKKDAMIAKLGTYGFQTTQYLTTNLMTGPSIKAASLLSTDIIPFAQVGVQMLITPKTTITVGNGSVTIGPDVGYGFVYALGCIFNMNTANIAVRYCGASPKVTEHYQLPGQDKKKLDDVTIKTDMIQVLVGVTF